VYKRTFLATGLILSLCLASCDSIQQIIPTKTVVVTETVIVNNIPREPVLTFGEQAAAGETARWTDELGNWKPATAVINGETKTLSSRYFKNNTIVGRTSQTAGVYLTFEWTEEGAQLSKIITGRLIGKPLGIFAGDQPLRTTDGHPIAPTVNEIITDRGQITGLSLEAATALSNLINIPYDNTSIVKTPVPARGVNNEPPRPPTSEWKYEVTTGDKVYLASGIVEGPYEILISGYWIVEDGRWVYHNELITLPKIAYPDIKVAPAK
jgi:hypothetical protein